MEIKQHIFENRGLGKAPFKCLGVMSMPSASMCEANPEAYNRAMADIPNYPGKGTCCNCGMAIMNLALIQDAEGKRFFVGVDCMTKTGDAGLRNSAAAIKTSIANKRADERIEAAFKALDTDPKIKAAFEAKPSPNKWQANRMEYITWMRNHAGRAGSLKIAREIEGVL